MSWWVLAVVAWVLAAFPAAVLLGAAARATKAQELASRATSVPDRWSLTSL